MGAYRTGLVFPMQAGLKLHLSVSRICAFSRVHVSILCTLNILGTSALQSSSSNTLVVEVLAVLLGCVTGVVVIVAAIVIGCCVCTRRRKLSKSLKVLVLVLFKYGNVGTGPQLFQSACFHACVMISYPHVFS